MPTSDARQIPVVLSALQRIEPRTVLDVGAGYGKYGVLCREYLPSLERIEAVEAWPRAMLYDGYDDVYAGDFLSIDLAPGYDALLLIDVVEHFAKLRGYDALARARDLARHVIVATPFDPAPQGAVGGNEFERHRSRWSFNDVASVNPGRWTHDLSIPGCVIAHMTGEPG
jgi:hypothetical protein